MFSTSLSRTQDLQFKMAGLIYDKTHEESRGNDPDLSLENANSTSVHSALVYQATCGIIDEVMEKNPATHLVSDPTRF